MILQVPIEEIFIRAEFVCHAVPRRSLSDVATLLGAHFETRVDDLDTHEIAAFQLDGTIPFVLMRYRGHPEAETRLLLAHDPHNVMRTHRHLARALDALTLNEDAVGWTRAQSSEP